MSRLFALGLSVFVVLSGTARAEMYLLMAEQAGCHWCARWDAEIAHIYPKTVEGKAAPLRRYDLHAGAPDGVTFAKTVRYTPTFILIEDGVEIGRLEGYAGDDLFWPMLAKTFERAGKPVADAG